MAVVRSDQDGLFIRTGGYVFRPKPGKFTQYQDGDNPYSRHIGGTTRAKIGQGPRAEFWIIPGTTGD